MKILNGILFGIGSTIIGIVVLFLGYIVFHIHMSWLKYIMSDYDTHIAALLLTIFTIVGVITGIMVESTEEECVK